MHLPLKVILTYSILKDLILEYEENKIKRLVYRESKFVRYRKLIQG